MIVQISPQNIDPTVMVPTLLLWIITFSISVWLIRKKTLSKNRAIGILSVTFVISGILLGAMPNSVSPINQFFVLIGFTSSQPLQYVLPILILLFILLVVTAIFGRIYCGYACPLGAMQELSSKILFKSNIKDQKQVKLQIKPSERILSSIRWIYMFLFIIIALVWGLIISELMNLFIAFQFFQGSTEYLLIIPIIFLIIIFISSFFIYRPWCRFFCPFGTLANTINRLYRMKLTRTDNCTDCGLCEEICPTQEADRDSSKAECYFCTRCIEVCPHDAIIYTKAV